MPVENDAYRKWTPAAQQRALEALQRARNDNWRPFFCRRPNCDGMPHDEWTWNHGRWDQHPPTDEDWLTWLIQSGRGAGKTRVGSEVTHRMTEVVPRLAIVAATGADVRDTCLEGESGILTIARPGNAPTYEPSKRRLTWPNGCIGTTFSAEEPDRLRGPEHGFAWLDEPAHWPLVQAVWDNLLFGLRIGKRPRIVVTTTPKPRPWLRELRADPRTRITITSTYANLANLAPTFAEAVIARYEGTRLGRQELLGELLDDIEGALWHYGLIEPFRVGETPDLIRIVVGVDPAGSSSNAADETGIVVAGVDRNAELYVLEDCSGRYTPHGWATRVKEAYDTWEADAVVAEKNYGGDMVAHTLRVAGVTHRLILATARRGKALRAEPLVGLYEQGKVHHVGVFPELEAQMTEWVPYEMMDKSPDRLDALVYATALLLVPRQPATLASPTTLKLTPAR